MDKPVFSLDVESSGPLPGKHSLLSIGVHETVSGKGFYAELKPEKGEKFVRESVHAVALELLCLTSEERYRFALSEDVEIIRKALQERGEDRPSALKRLKSWMDSIADTDDFESYSVVAGPTSFDAGFVFAAAGLSDAERPCKFSWECLSSVRRAVRSIMPEWQPHHPEVRQVVSNLSDDAFSKSIVRLGIGKHNSYFDAVAQAIEWDDLQNALRQLTLERLQNRPNHVLESV